MRWSSFVASGLFLDDDDDHDHQQGYRAAMNSYVRPSSCPSQGAHGTDSRPALQPVHFLSQPRPLLFVAGLDRTPTALGSTSSSSAQPPSSNESALAASPAPSADDAAFASLSHRLRELFERQGGLNVWEREPGPSSTEPVAGQDGGAGPAVSATAQGKRRERKEFRILLVDKVRVC